jgi:hypothetical protein
LRHQVHAAVGAERRDASPPQVERIQIAVAHREQPLIVAAFPEVDASRARGAGFGGHLRRRLLPPEKLAGRSVEGLDQTRGIRRVKNTADHRRRRAEIVVRPQFRKLLLQLRIERRPAPDDLQVLHVVAIDLRERRVPLVRRVPARRTPFAVSRLVLRLQRPARAHRECEGESNPDSAESPESQIPNPKSLVRSHGSASATYSAGSLREPIGMTMYCLPFSM